MEVVEQGHVKRKRKRKRNLLRQNSQVQQNLEAPLNWSDGQDGGSNLTDWLHSSGRIIQCFGKRISLSSSRWHFESDKSMD